MFSRIEFLPYSKSFSPLSLQLKKNVDWDNFLQTQFQVISSSKSTPKSLKPASLHQFPNSKTVFLGGSISRTLVDEKKKVSWPKNEPYLIRNSATRSDDVEGFTAPEKKAILGNGSSEFCPGFMADGLESTLNQLSKWLVAAFVAAFILWKHDAEAMWAAMGSAINALLSLTLKQIFNQKRPLSTSTSDPGMPSSHAQSIFFATMLAILSLIKLLGINEVTVTVGVLALAFSSYLSWLRVSQQFHTISQVVVGAIVGSIFSVLWFQSWDIFVLNAFFSYLWVRISVVLGGASFCLGFLLYVIQYWL